MDGAKSVTDTIGISNECSRQAFLERKSAFISWHESPRNENPGDSKNLAELESLPP